MCRDSSYPDISYPAQDILLADPGGGGSKLFLESGVKFTGNAQYFYQKLIFFPEGVWFQVHSPRQCLNQKWASTCRFWDGTFHGFVHIGPGQESRGGRGELYTRDSTELAGSWGGGAGGEFVQDFCQLCSY